MTFSDIQLDDADSASEVDCTVIADTDPGSCISSNTEPGETAVSVSSLHDVSCFVSGADQECPAVSCAPLKTMNLRLVNYSSSDSDSDTSYACASVADDDDTVYPLTPCIERFAHTTRQTVKFSQTNLSNFAQNGDNRDNIRSDIADALPANHLSNIAVIRPNRRNIETGSTCSEVSHISSTDDSGDDNTDVSNDTDNESDYSGSSESKITIYSKLAHGNGKNRKLPCYYCEKYLYQMPRHLKRQHSDESQVIKALKNTSDEHIGLQLIANLGTYKHNMNVLKTGDGVLIVGRSPKLMRHPSDFLPCQFCFVFFVKTELYRHCRDCKFRSLSAPEKGFIAAGRALVEGALHADGTSRHEQLREHVVPRMRTDKRTKVATSDRLIMCFGDMLLHKLGRKRALDVSARMRELARLLIQLKTHGQFRLTDYISGSGFDKVVKAFEIEGRFYMHESGRQMFKSPAFVLKAGNSILKCAQLKRGLALRNGDSVALKDADDFISLHSSEFTDKLSSAAHASLRVKGNSLNEYPEEADLQKLKTYLTNQMTAIRDQLCSHPDPYLWRELAELTLARLLIFNARRGSEGAELTLADYTTLTSQVDSAVAASFTDVERQLLSR